MGSSINIINSIISIMGSATMSGIKLTYFNLKGRAELARLILAQAEVDYEDCRIEKEGWAELKTTLPLGQLPVLEVDGQTIGQSITIARYLARRFGLAGKTDLDAAEADQAVDALTDMINSFSPLMKEKDEEKRAELKTVFGSETMPAWMKMMETLLTSKGGKHFAGNQLTWADIAIYNNLDMFQKHFGEPNLTECPNLKKNVGNCEESSKYQE